jgi:Peptidase family S41
MIISKYLFSILIGLLIISCGKSEKKRNSSEKPSKSIKKIKSKQKKVESGYFDSDFHLIISSLESIHPQPWNIVSKSNFIKEINKSKLKLKTSRSLLDFWKQISPIIHSLKDSHTSISIPVSVLRSGVKKGVKFFPLSLYLNKNKAFLGSDYEGIKAGTEIKSINSIPMSEIINKLSGYISWERRGYGLRLLENSFGGFLYMVYGFSNEFTITYENRGKIQKVKLKGHSSTATGARNLKASREVLGYRYLKEIDGALLTIKAFGNKAKFKKWVELSLLKIEKSKVKNIIIDLRSNYGGNSRLGDLLIKSISSTKYVQFLKVEIKISKFIQNKYPTWRKIQKIKLGTLATIFNYRINPSSPNKNQIKMKSKYQLFLLTDTTTYSSGVSFAAAFRSFSLGTIIGQETGGAANHYGDVVKIPLSSSALTLNISHKKFKTIEGSAKWRGVIPHIILKENIKTVLSKRDSVLEYAINLIRTQKGVRGKK